MLAICTPDVRVRMGIQEMKSLKFVFVFAKKYKAALVLTVISMLMLVGAQLLIPWVIRQLVNIITTSTLSADRKSVV